MTMLKSFITVLAVLAIGGIITGVLYYPRHRITTGPRVSSANELAALGIAMQSFALTNGGRFPKTLENLRFHAASNQVTRDSVILYFGENGLAHGILAVEKPSHVVAKQPSWMSNRIAVLKSDFSVSFVQITQLPQMVFTNITNSGFTMPR